MIYLDNAASTPILQQVKEKLLRCLEIYGNPSSIHNEGIKAKNIIYEAKDIISNRLNCESDELYFTSGATMSNNLLLQGFNGSVFCSSIEHEDILMTVEKLHGEKILVNSDGTLDLNDLKKKITEYMDWYEGEPVLFSIQMANSEIGTIQDIYKISNIIHTYPNAYLHVDATQYIPYFEVDVQELKIDALSMSGQKIGCIKGIGLLYIKNTLLPLIKPIIHGKQGLVGGTENVIGIACLGEAFKCLDYNNEELIKLRNMLISGLNRELIGSLNDRLPNNVNVCFEGLDSNTVVLTLNDCGICCSSGSACSSGDLEPSETLKAIGLPHSKINSCVRFTINKNTTTEEIEKTIEVVNATTSFLYDLGGK